MLYLEHTVEDLARGEPWRMGTLQRGGSSWRILRDEETAAYGGSIRRRLYGCLVTMADGRSDAPVGVAWGDGGRSSEAGAQQRLLSWSQVSVPVCRPALRVCYHYV